MKIKFDYLYVDLIKYDESSLDSLIDLQELIRGNRTILATSKNGNIAVLITDSYNTDYCRAGRIFYIINKIPIPAGYWMDWNERDEYSNVSNNKYNNLTQYQRAQIEANRQHKYPIVMEYYDRVKMYSSYFNVRRRTKNDIIY